MFPVCCYIFHLAKLLVALDTLIAIPVNLNVFLIYAQTITFHCFGAYQHISLLNLPNSATAILYHSSLALSFSSLQSLSTWCDNCSIRSLSNFSLIMTKCLWRSSSIWPVDCMFGPRKNIALRWVCRFKFCYLLEFDLSM